MTSSNEIEIETNEINDSFKNDVVQFDIIDNKIKELKKHIEPLQKYLKKLKAEKVILQQSICRVMKFKEVGLCNLPKDPESNKIPGTIKFVQTNSVVPLTSEQVKKLIGIFFEKEYDKLTMSNKKQKCNALIDFIYNKDNRPKVIKESIRKVKYIPDNLIEDTD